MTTMNKIIVLFHCFNFLKHHSITHQISNLFNFPVNNYRLFFFEL